MKMVIIASSPRVGSSLVSDLLTQAEAGYVAEHFNLSVHVPRVAKENGLKNLQEHFDFISDNYSSHDGNIFTVKCHFDQFFNYTKKVDIFSRFEKTEFIQIKRKSSLDQAISYFLAKATGTWSAKKVKNLKAHNQKILQALRKTPDKKIYQDVLKTQFRLQQNEAHWDFYLQNQEKHIFYYEDLLTVEGVNNAEATFSELYQKNIGIDRSRSEFKVQRDDEITVLIKEKIAPYMKTPPPISLFDSCLEFDNSFYGYSKGSTS